MQPLIRQISLLLLISCGIGLWNTVLYAEEEPDHSQSHEEHSSDSESGNDAGGTEDHDSGEPSEVEHLSDLLDARLPESEERLRLSVSSEHPVTRDTHGFEEPTYIDLSLPPTGGIHRKSSIQEQTETDGDHASVVDSEMVSHVNHFEGHDASNPHFDTDTHVVVTEPHPLLSETDERSEDHHQTMVVDGIHGDHPESENDEILHTDGHLGEDTHIPEMEHSVSDSHLSHELDLTEKHPIVLPEDTDEQPIHPDTEHSVVHSSNDAMYQADEGDEAPMDPHSEQINDHKNEVHSGHDEDHSLRSAGVEKHNEVTSSHHTTGHETVDSHAEHGNSHQEKMTHSGSDESYELLATKLHDATVQLIMSEIRGKEEPIIESIQSVSGALQAIIDKSAIEHSSASAKHLEKEAREMAIHIDRIDYALFQKDMRKVSVLVGKVASKVKELEHNIENMSEQSEHTTEEDHSSHALHH